MNITQKRENDTLTVYIEGNIDTVTAPALSDFLKNEIKDTKELILDFAKVDYISSAGLRVVLLAQKAMNAQGKMCVANVNEAVMEIFQITCFTDILTII